MAKSKTRNDGGPMTPEDLAAAIKAFQERKAARMGGGHGDDTPPATDPTSVPPAAPAAVGGEKKDEGDPVQMVKDRRDRRDADGDPDTLRTPGRDCPDGRGHRHPFGCPGGIPGQAGLR